MADLDDLDFNINITGNTDEEDPQADLNEQKPLSGNSDNKEDASK